MVELSYFRHVKTQNERRSYFSAFDQDIQGIEDCPFRVKVRGKRSIRGIVTYFSDIARQHHRSWKKHRRLQYKVKSVCDS